jgi:predicted CXXCH cytochrome family protein
MNRAGDRRARLHPRDALVLVVGLLVLVLEAGCISPERRYRVLSFLFDGVPPPGAVAPEEPATASSSPRKRTARARTRARAPVFIRHEPDCDECHDGDRGSHTLALPKDELCWDCHDSEDFEGEVVHGPVAAGECTGCHSPHKSQFDYLLLSKGSAVCARCHDASTFPGMAAHLTDQGDDCLGCHNPHAGDREYMLLEEARAP